MVTPLTPRTVLWSWLLLMLLVPLTALAGEIQVRASRNPVALAESFSLQFIAKESPDGEPDFSPLEQDFDILSRNQSRNFQFINGQQSQSITWTLELMPKHAGNLVIPPIAFGKDRSTLASITVQPATSQSSPGNPGNPGGTAQQGLLLEAELSTKTPHVQEQTILTIRFLRAIDIANASMEEPKLSSGDAILEKLGEDQTYESQRNGQRYLVTERVYALFPQRSGKLVIDPVPLTAQLPGQGGRSLLQDFFKDPLFNNLPMLGSGRPGRTVRITSQPLELEVQPTPPELTGQPWLPLHRLFLAEKWSPDPPELQVGEPVTRTLTLMGDGLTAAQLPSLADTPPDGIKHYPDRPILEEQKEITGIIGRRIEKIALIPSAPGSYLLPAIKIPWWNVDTKKMEIAQLPEHRITVKPAPGATAAPSAKPQSQSTPQPARQATPAAPATPPAQPAPAPPATPSATNIWPWVSLLLACGWLATALLWLRARRDKITVQPVATQSATDQERKKIAHQLQSACQANDPVAARAALFAHPLCHSPLLAAEIQSLNAALFGRLPTPWQGANLWSVFQTALQESRHLPRAEENLLPPLYPA